MGQITIAFAEDMLRHSERGEHMPLTVHEEEQLVRRWLESEHLRERCADSLRFYGALNVGDLLDKQAQQIERLQEKLHRFAPAEPARLPQVRA